MKCRCCLGIVDHLRRRFARFKLCAHLLDLCCLLFELRRENVNMFLRLRVAIRGRRQTNKDGNGSGNPSGHVTRISGENFDSSESKTTEKYLMADWNVDNVADAIIKHALHTEAGLNAVATSLNLIGQQIGALSEVLKSKGEPGPTPISN